MERIYEIEWEIRDTRNLNGGFRLGRSKLITNTKTIAEGINHVVAFADSIPDCELKRNGINLQDYREGKNCSVYRETKLSRIIKISKYEGK